MSAPMRRIIARLRARGVEVYEMPGWEARCRCHNGSHETDPRKVRAWTTDRLGFTVHITTSPRHTGNKAIAYTANILIGGNGSVPGPLCQWGIDGDGRVIVVAAGRSNHVGQIGDDAMDMTKAGTFSLSSKYDNRGQGAAVDGNTVLDGVEILSSPGPSEKQRAATVALAAEWCREYSKPATVVHGHGEVATSRGYSDPGMHMGEFRSAVASDLRAISSGSTIPLGDTPTPTSPTSGTPTVQEDDMPLNQTDLDAIKQIVDRGRNDVDIANQKRIDAVAEDADLARRVSIANQERIDRYHSTTMGVLSGVVAALQQISGGEGVDMSQITAAAERGAREGAKQGLEDGLEVTVKPAGKDA